LFFLKKSLKLTPSLILPYHKLSFYFSLFVQVQTAKALPELGGMSAGTGNDDKAATEDPVLRCCRKVSDSRSLADVTAALPALKQMHQACALGVCARRVRPACAPGVCACVRAGV
jgi:hypothetical protein